MKRLAMLMILGCFAPMATAQAEEDGNDPEITPVMATVEKLDAQEKMVTLHYVLLVSAREAFRNIPSVQEELDRAARERPGGDRKMVGSYRGIGIPLNYWQVMTTDQKVLPIDEAMKRLTPGRVVLFYEDTVKLSPAILSLVREDALIVMKKPAPKDPNVCEIEFELMPAKKADIKAKIKEQPLEVKPSPTPSK